MNQSPKKRSEPAKKIGGGSLPLATASSPRAAESSATPSNGGHPRNAPGKLRKEEQYKNEPWPHIEIQDACEFIVDCVNKTAPVVDHKTPYRMIRTTNVREGRINLEECRYVTEDTYLRWTRRATVEDGDVLLTREAPIGEVGYAEGLGKVFLGQRIMQYRSRPSILQPRFLFYSFQSHTLTSQFSAHEGSGSVVSHIRVGDCFKFRVPLPPLPIQQRIASILGTLDDKIALNRRINQTLEAMAQALFQSWFVDFDPVKAKQKILGAGGTAREAELAAMQIISGKNSHQLKTFQQTQPQQYAELEHTGKLFPNRLVESELGPVPEGWAVKTLGSLCSLITKGTTPTNSDIQGANDIPTVPYIKVKDISSEGEIIRNTLELIPESVHLGALKRSVVFENDILFSIAGSIGRIAVIDADLTNSNTNQAVGIIRLENKSMHFYWVLQSIKSKRIQDNIASKVVQGVQANTSLANLRDIQLIQPEDDILQDWNKHIDFLLDSVRMNQNEERMLVEIRDSLLPKLLSGEIDVSSLEIV